MTGLLILMLLDVLVLPFKTAAHLGAY